MSYLVGTSTFQTAAVGTAYSLTNSAAALDFGTTDPVIVITQPGTYLLTAYANLCYVAATFAAARQVDLKLRRTNNTAADIAGGALVLFTDIITTTTATMGVFRMPFVLYTTVNSDDSLTIFGSVGTVPSAGTLDATAAQITAIRIG